MPGRARGNQVRLRPKTTRPTKSGYGDWSHHRLRCGIFALRRSRRLVLAQFLIHELARRPAGATERWPGGFREYQTAPSRLSATALASPELGDPVKRGACFRLARMYHQPPLRRICTALVGTEGSNPVCSSGESTNYGFLGGGGASAVCSAVPNVQIHLPSSGESANYHSFCHGRWMVNPSEPDPVARGLYSVRGRRGAAT